MKRLITMIVSITFITVGLIICSPFYSYANEVQETLKGRTYDFGEKDEYELYKGQEVADNTALRLFVKGDIKEVGTQNEFVSFAVDSDNLKIVIDEQFGKELYDSQDAKKWHIITDKTNKLNGKKLADDIGSGVILIQTSKDGRLWLNADYETDYYNRISEVNNRTINGEAINAFYETTNVQLNIGCYYRIIVAYKMQREVDPSKILFVNKTNTEEKERVEIYQFYAYNPNVNRIETLDTKKAYEFGNVYRVDSPNGFENPELIKSDDPHIDWSVGKFYVSGYTDYRMDGDIPVFLKNPGDKAALWFNLEQEIERCNGRSDVQINYIESGSDTYFGTPNINNFGRGALIIRKTDKQNQKERQIYTNYLEATATVGANTRVDLFEEGDYEVALDYQLHYDKPFVFGTTSTKTLTYRSFFKFKVRNGDISAFLRDIKTNQFITNANVAENGFYIDVANSQYLNMSIKREVLTPSMDGLIEDTKFAGVAIDGRHYTDEGIYTVTIKNLATGDTVEKRVYVGDRDILLAYMKTEIPINEIKERLAAGSYIDENGQIIDPEPEPEPEPDPEPEATPSEAVIDDNISDTEPEEKIAEETPELEDINTTASGEENLSNENINENEETKKEGTNGFVILSIIVVLCVAGGYLYHTSTPKNKVVEKMEDNEE